MANARLETKLWLWQRLSAAILGICVVIHLTMIVYAVRGGLSAAEIVDRVSGNLAWLTFYVIFVTAVAVHAPIGVRAILKEATSLGQKARTAVTLALALVIFVMGLRAALSLFSAGGAG